MGISISDPVSSVISLGTSLIDRLFPDPAQKAQAQLALLQLQSQGELAELTSKAGIVQAEAQSSNWLTAAWRPLTMLVFVGLITARWFGFSAPNISQAEALELWAIVKIGLGGYVIGRSAEKIVPSVAVAVAVANKSS